MADAAHTIAEQDLGPREAYMRTAGTITRLLDEVLSEVLLQCANGVREAYYQSWHHGASETPPNSFSWLPITHVCRHWRDVALASPRLWSHVDVWKNDRTATFIKRSGKVPLTIRHYKPSYTAEAIGLVFEHIARVRVLDLNCSSMPGQNPSLDQYKVPQDAPLILEELCLSCVNVDYVRTLVRPQMTHLSISTGLGSVADWTEIVSGLPHLVELELVFVMQPNDDEVASMRPGARPVATNIIELPYLERLHLSGNDAGMGVAQLLGRLAFPSSARVLFDAHWLNIEPDIGALLPAIFGAVAAGVQRSMDGPAREMRALRVYRRFGDTLVVEAWPTPRSAAELHNNFTDRTPGRVELTLHTQQSPLEDILRAALAALPLARVETLAVLGSEALPWAHFAALQDVTELAVAFTCPAVALASAFAVGPGDEAPLLFPALRTLSVAGAHWGRRVDAAGEEIPEGRALAERLQAALWQRRELGVPVQKLCVPWGVELQDGVAEEFRASGAVEEVEWSAGENPEYAKQRESLEGWWFGNPDSA
ncbi:hypothetical protein PsYK624_090420 [Phanerochaete sordida]|uniref:F-box domain-containing protein n=1 Tax=Phanerochaete sordida TaxID=48140 RepID=A0A9P3GFR2_9APHY|nr:hypothetical protein PsYK624_090420 [Phanerochaete sordida]